MNMQSSLKATALFLSLLPLSACGWGTTNSSTTYQSDCIVSPQNGQRPAATVDRKAEYPDATSLTVNGFVADVTITPADVKSVRYTFTAQRGLTQLMEEQPSSDGKAIALRFNCEAAESPVVINDLPRLNVTVPYGIDLNIGKTDAGSMAIGDTKGPLHATISGSGSTQVGDITNLSLDKSGSGSLAVSSTTGVNDIEQSGSGSLEINSISGRTEIHTSGSGSITLKGETIPYLLVGKSGSGDVSYNGHAKQVQIDTSGSGDITIESADSVDKTISGSGLVTINQTG